MQKNNYFTVSELNNLIKNIIESEILFQDLWLSGEISNLRFYQNGSQIYFNLIDEKSQINCVLYSNSNTNFKFLPKNGLKVRAKGKIKVFHKKGTYTFQVAYMLEQGEGEQKKDFEKLKNKLLKEGLFDPGKKKEIPKYPHHIGLITAQDSAAMWDFVSISQKLAPHLKLYLIPAVMQGQLCPNSVSTALDTCESREIMDIIIILRGGGGSEDISGFNDEPLVRRIFKCKIPVISAIGHEINYTLTDFVSDLRLPTPSAAAQKIGEQFLFLKQDICHNLNLISEAIIFNIKAKKEMIHKHLAITSTFTNTKVALAKRDLEQYSRIAEAANPLNKFRQGFSISRLKKNGKIIKNIAQVNKEDIVTTELIDGSYDVEVLSKNDN